MTTQTLVIAEKPSVGMSIAAVLGAGDRKPGYTQGSGYLVSWCFGHLAELANADAYDEKYAKWRYEDLPILPEPWKHKISRDKYKQFEVLRELMHRSDVTLIVNACDAGREGELIFRNVYQMTGCTKPVKRLWISSMEDEAVRRGFETMQDGAAYPDRKEHEGAVSYIVPKRCVGVREPYSAERRKADSQRAKAAGRVPPGRK